MLLMPFKRLLFHLQRTYSNEIKNALKSNFFKNKPGDLSGFSIDVTDLLKHWYTDLFMVPLNLKNEKILYLFKYILKNWYTEG